MSGSAGLVFIPVLLAVGAAGRPAGAQATAEGALRPVLDSLYGAVTRRRSAPGSPTTSCGPSA